MITLSRHPGSDAVEIDPATIVRIGKVKEVPDGADPSFVITASGGVTVSESIRTIGARCGDAVVLCDYDDPSIARPAVFNLGLVAAMTKRPESSGEGDPTLVHLTTGEVVLVHDSIRTLSARLNLKAGLATVEVDVHGSDRPAAVVAAHVADTRRLVRSDGADPRCLVLLAGGASLLCHDDPDRLERSVAEASRPPEDPADEPVDGQADEPTPPHPAEGCRVGPQAAPPRAEAIPILAAERSLSKVR
jgi:hypothetical protein